MFQTTKIQTFESNSQPTETEIAGVFSCFRLQRYKLLKAIHNCKHNIIYGKDVVSDYKDTNFWKQFTTAAARFWFFGRLFQTTKIQTFESNSQPRLAYWMKRCRCFRLQRYKLLKAIHNKALYATENNPVVSDYKDTNFWKQFTTGVPSRCRTWRLFQTTKIQTFESNSQLEYIFPILKSVVSDYKDTNFWKQFTTAILFSSLS